MIRILDQKIADRIAAGEVITSSKAVIKELVENALDAGADRITVEIRKGGKAYIRVTDNGTGIVAEEVELAFQKHATGKIYKEEDLAAIGTLGFRGEALPSIAAVAQVEMITKTAEEKAGTRLVLRGGQVLEKKSIGCETGTSVVVEDLFFNTPARLKFMRSDSAEAAAVLDFLSKAAIAYPHVRFKVVNNGAVLFHTQGKGQGLAAIMTVYGAGLKGKLLPVEGESPDGTMQMVAYVANPMENRPSKKQQIFFVNGRLVQDKVLEEAVAAAYKGRMFAGRYPIVYLFLETTPDLLDVNIHPSKDKIRFYHPNRVREFVESHIYQALQTKDLVPEAGRYPEHKETPRSSLPEVLGEKVEEASKKGQEIRPVEKPAPEKDTTSGLLQQLRQQVEQEARSLEQALGQQEVGTLPTTKTAGEQHPEAGNRPDNSIKKILSTLREEQQCLYTPASTPILDQRPFDFSRLQRQGIIFDTYILAADEEALYLIDQHAAHERVLYEAIKAPLTKPHPDSQVLLLPLVFEYATLDDHWMDALSTYGFDIQPFGPHMWQVREIPMAFAAVDVLRFLKDFTDTLGTGQEPLAAAEEFLDRLATMACKAAVKAHDRLAPQEADELLVALAKCQAPFACPHGRPTFLKLTKSRIESDFKRQ